MQNLAYDLDAFRILDRKTRWFFSLSLGSLLVAGCVNTQKDQPFIEDAGKRPHTIPIEPTLVEVGNPFKFHLVWYSAPQIDLGKVPVNEIEIGVVDPKEVMAHSNSGSSALSSLTERARQLHRILKAQEEKLKIMQEGIKGTADGAPGKMKLQGEFETELEKYKQNGKMFQEELQGEQKRIVNLYTSRIRSAVEVVAMREGLDLVLDNFKDFKAAENLLSPEVRELLQQVHRDITSETVQEMDKMY